MAVPVSRRNDARMLRAGDRAELIDGRAWALAKEQMTDGKIERVQLRLLGANEEDVEALVREGLWIADSDGWQILGFTDVNMTHEHVLKLRAQAAERKRRQRGKQNDDDPDTRDSGRDVPRESRGTGKQRDEEDPNANVNGRGRVSGPRDDTRDSHDALDVAQALFPNLELHEPEKYIKIARKRGYTDPEIVDALGQCEAWPRELLGLLPVRRAAPDPGRAGPWCYEHQCRPTAQGCPKCADDVVLLERASA